MDEGLGKRFWLKTVGLVIGCGILIVVSWFLISGLVFRFGLIAALVIVLRDRGTDRPSLRHEAAASVHRVVRPGPGRLGAWLRPQRHRLNALVEPGSAPG